MGLASRRDLDNLAAVSVDEDKTIEDLPPVKKKRTDAEGEAEDEATTLWAKSDLFSPDDLDTQEEEPIFAEKALVRQDDDLSASTVEVEPGLGPGATPSAVQSADSAPETVRMSPSEAQAAMREAHAAAEGFRPSSSIQVGGVEGVAARKLDEERRAARAAATAQGPVVAAQSATPAAQSAAAQPVPAERRDAGPSLAASRGQSGGELKVQKTRLSCNCRICGRGVTAPQQRRLRGPVGAEHGFRCDTCHNVFCAAHVVRVSGLLESLLKMGRFRCVLCDQGKKDAPRANHHSGDDKA